MPILIVALVGAQAVADIVGDVALLPGRQPRLQRLGIGAWAQGHVDPARLTSPAGEELRFLRHPVRNIDVDDGIRPDVAVARDIPEDCHDPVVARDTLRDQGDRPPDDVVGAETRDRLGLTQHDRIDGREGGCIAAQQRQVDHVEQIAIGEDIIARRQRLAVLDDDGRTAERVDRLIDLREILLEGLARRVGCHLQIFGLAGILAAIPGLELVDILDAGDPAVEAQLVADEQQDHQAGGHADGEPEDVDERIDPVLEQGPQPDREIIAQHRLALSYGLGERPSISGYGTRGTAGGGEDLSPALARTTRRGLTDQAARRRSAWTCPSSMLTTRPA